jgi:hypothetical protein
VPQNGALAHARERTESPSHVYWFAAGPTNVA